MGYARSRAIHVIPDRRSRCSGRPWGRSRAPRPPPPARPSFPPAMPSSRRRRWPATKPGPPPTGARHAAREGDVWQEAKGEQQDPYGGVRGVDPALRGFRSAGKPCRLRGDRHPCAEALAPTQFTVGYSVLTEAANIPADSPMYDGEVPAAPGDPRSDRHPMPSARSSRTPFDPSVSTRRPRPKARQDVGRGFRRPSVAKRDRSALHLYRRNAPRPYTSPATTTRRGGPRPSLPFANLPLP